MEAVGQVSHSGAGNKIIQDLGSTGGDQPDPVQSRSAEVGCLCLHRGWKEQQLGSTSHCGRPRPRSVLLTMQQVSRLHVGTSSPAA